MVSVIVPVYNEEKALSQNLTYLSGLSKESELIFVDGGSRDKSVEISQKISKTISHTKGRAVQMNCGARAASGDILLFLHADTSVSPDSIGFIEDKIRNNNLIGGCLSQSIAAEGATFRLLEKFGNTRARLTNVFYGDQGIFVRKDIFFKLGGFPDVPIMEDVIFTRALRKAGKVTVLHENITVSPRRWKTEGVVKSACLYLLINILFWIRVPLERIKTIYNDVR